MLAPPLWCWCTPPLGNPGSATDDPGVFQQLTSDYLEGIDCFHSDIVENTRLCWKLLE